MKKSDFVSEANGQGSSMRLVLLGAYVLAGLLTVAIVIYCIVTGKFDSIPIVMPLIAVWLAIPTTGKVGQKYGEEKNDDKPA